MHLNPLSPFFVLLRDPLLAGRVPPGEMFLSAGITTFVAFGLAGMLCSRLQRRLVFQL